MIEKCKNHDFLGEFLAEFGSQCGWSFGVTFLRQFWCHFAPNLAKSFAPIFERCFRARKRHLLMIFSPLQYFFSLVLAGCRINGAVPLVCRVRAQVHPGEHGEGDALADDRLAPQAGDRVPARKSEVGVEDFSLRFALQN